METSFAYYLFVLAASVVVVVVVKKMARCLINTVGLRAIVALMAYIYFNFFAAAS